MVSSCDVVAAPAGGTETEAVDSFLKMLFYNSGRRRGRTCDRDQCPVELETKVIRTFVKISQSHT